mgnify:CR=1 FL=1
MAFLVVGDPFGATTHADLMIRARELGIKTKTIHNASIMNAIGCCGLQLYSFGETVSIPFWTEDWQPDSFFDKIQVNFISSIFHTGSNNQFQNYTTKKIDAFFLFAIRWRFKPFMTKNYNFCLFFLYKLGFFSNRLKKIFRFYVTI